MCLERECKPLSGGGGPGREVLACDRVILVTAGCARAKVGPRCCFCTHTEVCKAQGIMAQRLLAPAPPSPALTFRHLAHQRSIPTASPSHLVHQYPALISCQHMLEEGCGMSMVERDSLGMWGLSRLGVTLEQEQSMRQKQDFYLNYGRALRVIREDIPR